jgi:superfamily II DNA or RNA helicase
LNILIKNNLRLTDVPPDLRKELTERLQFPNPKWLENNRMGRWNRGTARVLRFYDRIRGGGLWIPRGYLRRLILMTRKKDIACTIEDRRRELPPIDIGFSARLKPFQRTAATAMLRKEFGTLSAPTGSGKTVIALAMIAQRRQPALIVVHTKDLAFQWIERIETFLGIPAAEVGLVGAGKRRVGTRLTVALVQSLYRCADEVAPQIGHLIVDECHRTPSRTFTDAVTEFDARYMLGLTATPWRRDGLARLIFWHLGDVHHEVDKARLIETGDVMPVEVITRETEFTPYYDPVNDYSRMLSELTADDRRNRLIAKDIAAEAAAGAGSCLVLSDRKKHCETLQALLRYRHKVDAALLTGDVPTEQRREVLMQLGQGEVKVLVATGQLVGEGFDCRELSTLFITTPVRFSGRLVQYLGRVLRPAPGKKRARVFDYVDSRVDVLKAAARARRRVYDQ